MKLETTPQDVAVNGGFKTSEFAIGDIAFIVDMFADKVYSNKERAVIRELACNAHDSHVMAGTTEIPFDVHLPTSLEPFFSVRDYGTGLTDHEVRTIFAGIGISTKRSSNEVIGCFGIGSLSPYSMTDSFNVKSYKDGICHIYTCYRDEQRKPVVALLVESETDEPNGLEVSLSVNGRIYDFEVEAENVFRFWEGTIPNINNKNIISKCEKQRNSYIFKSDDFGFTGVEAEYLYAVMGNISYKIPYELCEIRTGGYIKFELGELDFDTSRENLSMTDKVKTAIKNKIEQIKERLGDLAKEKIEGEPTKFKRAKMAYIMNKSSVCKHAKIDMNSYQLPKTTEDINFWKPKYRSVEKVETLYLPLGENIEYYEYSPRMNLRIREHIKKTGAKVVVLTPVQIVECEIDVDVLKNLNDLPAIERSATRSVDAKSNIKTFTFSNRQTYYSQGKDLWVESIVDLEAEELVYVEINRWEIQNSVVSGYRGEMARKISSLKESGISVPEVHGLKSSYIKSKQFSLGNWIHFDDYVVRELKKNLIDTIHIYDEYSFSKLIELRKNIESDELKECDKYVNMICHNDKITKIAAEFGVELKKDTSFQKWMDSYFDKYPILKILTSHDISGHPQKIAPYIEGVVR